MESQEDMTASLSMKQYHKGPIQESLEYGDEQHQENQSLKNLGNILKLQNEDLD